MPGPSYPHRCLRHMTCASGRARHVGHCKKKRGVPPFASVGPSQVVAQIQSPSIVRPLRRPKEMFVHITAPMRHMRDARQSPDRESKGTATSASYRHIPRYCHMPSCKSWTTAGDTDTKRGITPRRCASYDTQERHSHVTTFDIGLFSAFDQLP